MCRQYHKKEVTVQILNSIFLMFKKNDHETIAKTVEMLPGRLMDPMLRTFLSYESLKEDVALNLMMESFNFYKKYFGAMNTDKDFEVMMKELDEMVKNYENTAEGNYARRLLLTFIDEIELEYQERISAKAAS